MNKPLRIAFVHPSLGLGGAERLVVDAARSLEGLGHKTTIFTGRWEPENAFAETRELDVRVVPTRVPESVAGRLIAPANVLRMRRIARKLAAERGSYDVAVCDLTAHIVPELRASLGVPVAFYCHYPDTLLTGRDHTGVYGWYRKPIDAAELRGLESADCVLVNSAFTARQYEDAFPEAQPPRVLYPGADTGLYADIAPMRDSQEIVLLSVNRFRAAKSIGRAVEALAALSEFVPEATLRRVRLVLAGGYHEAAPDAVDTLSRLREQVARLGLSDNVEWVLNPGEPERLALLERARCLVYTPSNEHFGLGPIEAMAAGRPVVAVNSGGPIETIGDGETGRLCGPDAAAMGEALSRYVNSLATAREHGLAGRARVQERFSLERFRDLLGEVLVGLVESGSSQ